MMADQKPLGPEASTRVMGGQWSTVLSWCVIPEVDECSQLQALLRLWLPCRAEK